MLRDAHYERIRQDVDPELPRFTKVRSLSRGDAR